MFTKTALLGAASALLFGASQNNRVLRNAGEELSAARHAISILYPHGDSDVYGLVSFSQENITSPTKIVASIKNLKPNQLHGIHVHEYGDLTDGCTTAGPHFNPFHKKHGGPLDQERHVGDLGNIKADDHGHGYYAGTDIQIKLFGEHSILGRSVVVHQNEDDLGRGGHSDSHTTGHAGARVACGVIGLSSQFKNFPSKF